MSTPTWHPGRFVWREMMTPDLDKTTAFYTELFGWTTRDVDMGPMGVYRLFSAGETQIAGSVQMPNGPYGWMQYVSVPDVDATAASFAANGGAVVRPADDIPNIGRFAICTDPQGAGICLFKDLSGDKPPGRPNVGEFCWESLATTDKAGAAAFYSKVLGWETKEFKGGLVASIGENMVADIDDAPPGVRPAWLSHVAVADLAESRSRAEQHGAHILMAEIVIPNMGKMAVFADPMGAPLSIFQPQM